MTELQDSAQATDDLDQSDVTETSPNEETQVDPEQALNDIEIDIDDLDDDDESDETEEDEAVTESDEEVAEESTDDAEEESNEEDKTSAEDRKRQNDEYAKQRIADREAREAEKQRQQEEYLQSAEDDTQLALRQLQIDAYNNKVTQNLSKLDSQMDRAVADIDLFRTGSNAVKEELAQSLEIFERLHVQRDQNGDPVNVKGDLYQYLQEKAESIRRLTGDGARQEVKDKQLTKAKTDTLPTRTPKEPKKDPYLAAFEEEAARP